MHGGDTLSKHPFLMATGQTESISQHLKVASSGESKANAKMTGTIDSPDFNVVDFINQVFPNGSAHSS